MKIRSNKGRKRVFNRNYVASLDLDFTKMSTATFDSRITFSRGSLATEVGPDGLVRYAPHNYAMNTEMTGAVVGVIGSGGALPTGWSWSSAAGIVREVVAVGTLPSGLPYIDVRLSGTNANVSLVYPHIYFQASPGSYPASLVQGMSVAVTGWLERLAGSASGFTTSGNMTVQ